MEMKKLGLLSQTLHLAVLFFAFQSHINASPSSILKISFPSGLIQFSTNNLSFKLLATTWGKSNGERKYFDQEYYFDEKQEKFSQSKSEEIHSKEKYQEQFELLSKDRDVLFQQVMSELSEKKVVQKKILGVSQNISVKYRRSHPLALSSTIESEGNDTWKIALDDVFVENVFQIEGKGKKVLVIISRSIGASSFVTYLALYRL